MEVLMAAWLASDQTCPDQLAYAGGCVVRPTKATRRAASRNQGAGGASEQPEPSTGMASPVMIDSPDKEREDGAAGDQLGKCNAKRNATRPTSSREPRVGTVAARGQPLLLLCVGAVTQLNCAYAAEK